MRKIFYTICLLMAFTGTRAQPFNPLLAAMLQDTLDALVTTIPNVKGMSAGVYVPGQGVWQGVSGVSHEGCAVTPDMKFGIASNTKLFVATALLKLAAGNRLYE